MSFKIIKVISVFAFCIFSGCAEKKYLEIEQLEALDLLSLFDYSSLRKNAIDTLKLIEFDESILDYNVGFSPKTVSHYWVQRHFIKMLSLEEAENLYQRHPNPTIKGLAMEALYWKQDKNFGKKWINSRTDKKNIRISFQSGCTTNSFTHFGYFKFIADIHQIFHYSSPLIKKNERRTLDSLTRLETD